MPPAMPSAYALEQAAKAYGEALVRCRQAAGTLLAARQQWESAVAGMQAALRDTASAAAEVGRLGTLMSEAIQEASQPTQPAPDPAPLQDAPGPRGIRLPEDTRL